MTGSVKNNAFYYEVCILRILLKMGYLNNKELDGIVKIAAEDYNSTLLVDKKIFETK